MKISKRKGFTLIELLVVVLIIGILAAIALPSYQKAVKKSRAAQALIAVRSVGDSLKRFYMETGGENPTLDALDISMPVDEKFQITMHNYVDSSGLYATVRSKIPGDDKWVIRYWITAPTTAPQYKDKIICVGEAASGEETCKLLGGQNEHVYLLGPQFKAYYLN